MLSIIFATKNKGKLEEINKIMKDSNINFISMEDAKIDIDIIEDGNTFEENAIKKAEEIMRISGLVTIADDSGLEIDYLDGKPGVHSARYMGENTPYDIKNKKIIELLKDVEYNKRTARFVSVIATAIPNDETIITRGIIEGIIINEMRGINGFGYDPIFFVPEYNMTTAEMSLELKNSISHRGRALNLMKQELRERGIIK